MRRYPVVWRELEAQGERDGLGRVAFEQGELGPAGQGRAGPSAQLMPGAWTTMGPADGVVAACALAREGKATAHTTATTVSITWCFMGTPWALGAQHEGCPKLAQVAP